MIDFDPYTTLGVGPAVTPDEAKAAYRRKAKEAHPDAGGSESEFTTLNRAFSILSDPCAKQRYDSTGSTEEPGLDTVETAAIQMLGSFFDQMIALGQGAFTADLVNVFVSQAAQKRFDINGQVKYIKERIDINERLAARFSTKSGKESFFAGLARGRNTDLRRSIAGCEKQIEVIDRACAIMSDHSFTSDAAPFSFFGAYSNLDGGAYGKT